MSIKEVAFLEGRLLYRQPEYCKNLPKSSDRLEKFLDM